MKCVVAAVLSAVVIGVVPATGGTIRLSGEALSASDAIRLCGEAWNARLACDRGDAANGVQAVAKTRLDYRRHMYDCLDLGAAKPMSRDLSCPVGRVEAKRP